MAKNNFTDWDANPANNADVGGIAILGSNNVSNFDNALRAIMAQLKSGVDAKITLLGKSGNYTATVADNNTFIRCSAALTLSLTAAATLGANWHCWVVADGGVVTVDPNGTEQVDGSATIAIPNGKAALLICDGTKFYTDKSWSAVSPYLLLAGGTLDAGADLFTINGASNSAIVGHKRVDATLAYQQYISDAANEVRFATIAADGTTVTNTMTISTNTVGAIKLNGNPIVTTAQTTGVITATGSAPMYACRAFVNFNGSGTSVIRASGNVSSITDVGAGDYTVNFTTPMPDVNYTAVFGQRLNNTTSVVMVGEDTAYTRTVNAARVNARNMTSNTLIDWLVINVAIFR